MLEEQFLVTYSLKITLASEVDSEGPEVMVEERMGLWGTTGGCWNRQNMSRESMVFLVGTMNYWLSGGVKFHVLTFPKVPVCLYFFLTILYVSTIGNVYGEKEMPAVKVSQFLHLKSLLPQGSLFDVFLWPCFPPWMWAGKEREEACL